MGAAATYPFKEGGYTLYSCTTCPFARRAVRAFNAANVPYAVEEIDLTNKPEWYPQVNPRGLVPALRTPDGTILVESLVIAEFVAEQFPEAELLPRDPVARAQLRLFIDKYATEVTPNFYRLVKSADKGEQDALKAKLAEGFKAISAELDAQWQREAGRGGPFWAGDRWAYAEIALASFLEALPVLEHYRGFVVPSTDEFAAFHRWNKAVQEHPEAARAYPGRDTLIAAHKKFVPDA
ncbi:hypothetical protein IWQ57_001331 [Coemansia nantahalensis]|uniref:Uncharacterized protein n=1 Tax=Coemansia nantahalensis TaxID=2789366 RepID=A0ACC1K4V8_9FUNG|nr:hypothetical protein IWQ57_001331 [Coemansia nantahalensis]